MSSITLYFKNLSVCVGIYNSNKELILRTETSDESAWIWDALESGRFSNYQKVELHRYDHKLHIRIPLENGFFETLDYSDTQCEKLLKQLSEDQIRDADNERKKYLDKGNFIRGVDEKNDVHYIPNLRYCDDPEYDIELLADGFAKLNMKDRGSAPYDGKSRYRSIKNSNVLLLYCYLAYVCGS